jgi:molybdopterin molybdotransferase
MISVDVALGHLFALVDPIDLEAISLTEADGRVLAAPIKANRDQPPFAASAMDGYAVKNADVRPGARFHVIGEAAAGHRFKKLVTSNEAVRIFTGAPLPAGTDRVVIQEDVDRDGRSITLREHLDAKGHVRPVGADFKAGEVIDIQRRLTPSDIALLAAMNVSSVSVRRRPVVAIIPTGDELVQPGEVPNHDQIIASNSYGLAALLRRHGASPRLLPIAADTTDALTYAFGLCDDADLIVTIGGASVGDHDLVAGTAEKLGMQRAFYKVCMRPGKPLMAGTLKGAAMVGLPGNPVSAMVCGHVFLLPLINKLLGLGEFPTKQDTAHLAHDIGPNGPREHYMRAKLGPEGVSVFKRQDSALLSILSEANCLAVRPISDPGRAKGDQIKIIRL